jgi:hypothetical protein
VRPTDLHLSRSKRIKREERQERGTAVIGWGWRWITLIGLLLQTGRVGTSKQSTATKSLYRLTSHSSAAITSHGEDAHNGPATDQLSCQGDEE